MEEHGNIIIYKDKNGNDNIEVKMQDNTVWLNQEQLVKLYNSSKSNISEHIKHIFEDKELDENSVVRNFQTTEIMKDMFNYISFFVKKREEETLYYFLFFCIIFKIKSMKK